MAAIVQPTIACLTERTTRNDKQTSASPAPAELPLFRFRLRHLFLLVTAISVLLAAIVSLPGLPALALILGVLVVTFHVFGTALGNQLRVGADHRQARGMERSGPSPVVLRPAISQPVAPAVPWYGRSGACSAGYPRVVAAAALVGGCVGMLFLAATIGDRTSLAGLLVGGMSLAVISGWFAFLATTFFTIVRHGFRDAAGEQEVGHSDSPCSSGRVHCRSSV